MHKVVLISKGKRAKNVWVVLTQKGAFIDVAKTKWEAAYVYDRSNPVIKRAKLTYDMRGKRHD